jgi:hypothetical protein
MSDLRRRSSVSARGHSARRKLVWATAFGNSTVTNGATNNVDLGASLEVAGSSLLGVTVIRTHIRINVRDWASTADQFTYGLIIGRTADIGVGNSNGINGAASELDWMLYDQMFPTSSAAVVDVTSQRMIDLRAKRKMDELGQRYLLSFSNNSAAVHSLSYIARVLFALP